jgi:hypothetical protein
MDTQASKGDGPADTFPIDVAVAAIGGCTPSPQESALKLLHCLQGFLWWCKDQELVNRDCTEDGLNHGEAAGFVHEASLPCRQPPSNSEMIVLEVGAIRKPSQRNV